MFPGASAEGSQVKRVCVSEMGETCTLFGVPNFLENDWVFARVANLTRTIHCLDMPGVITAPITITKIKGSSRLPGPLLPPSGPPENSTR